MQQILQNIEGLGYSQLADGANSVGAQQVAQLFKVNPTEIEIMVGDYAVAQVVLLHGGDSNASVVVKLGMGAKLQLTQLCVGSGSVNLSVRQFDGAISEIVTASVQQNAVKYNIELTGAGAHSSIDTLQLGSEIDNNSLNINMRHLSPDCTSRSLSKCVASGSSNLNFEGLVYVAQDAQRTAAEQNCRCIELSDNSHIVAQPQLEIYADDVKCSHGATMGQMDSDAILYMRQRGLDEAQARRVQIEGFVTDIVDKCPIEGLVKSLEAFVGQKLESM